MCTTIGFLREILADTLFLEARHHTSRVDDMVSLRS